jgi:hypothetical protein
MQASETDDNFGGWDVDDSVASLTYALRAFAQR